MKYKYMHITTTVKKKTFLFYLGLHNKHFSYIHREYIQTHTKDGHRKFIGDGVSAAKIYEGKYKAQYW